MRCDRCGKLLKEYNEYTRNYCDDCQIQISDEIKEKRILYLNLRNEFMLERAVRRIEQHRTGWNKFEFYKPAIDAVKNYMLENPENLASTEEVIAAIVLIADEIHIKCQYKIGRHRVDFYIPEMKIILEVDGYMHTYSRKKDSKRDLEILKQLGAGWEILRIPTKYINAHPQQLVDALFKFKEEKQKLRRINGGNLAMDIAKVLE